MFSIRPEVPENGRDTPNEEFRIGTGGPIPSGAVAVALIEANGCLGSLELVCLAITDGCNEALQQ